MEMAWIFRMDFYINFHLENLRGTLRRIPSQNTSRIMEEDILI